MLLFQTPSPPTGQQLHLEASANHSHAEGTGKADRQAEADRQTSRQAEGGGGVDGPEARALEIFYLGILILHHCVATGHGKNVARQAFMRNKEREATIRGLFADCDPEKPPVYYPPADVSSVVRMVLYG